MSEKDNKLENELNENLTQNENSVSNSDEITQQENNVEDSEENAEAEDREWQFDAVAPTLDDNLELDGEFQVDMADADKTIVKEKAVISDGENITIKKKPVKIIFASIIGVIIVALLVVFGVRYYTVPNSNEKMNPGNVALKIGDTNVSVGMYDYFYATVVYEYEQYANYGYNNLDTSKDYSKQTTTDDEGNEITWLEKFEQDAIKRIKVIVAYYEKAEKAGIELTEDQQSSIDTQIESLEANASSADTSVDKYIQESYGEYCGVATLRKYLKMYYLASSYYNTMSIDEKPTDDEIEAYFNDNKEKYMACKYAFIETPYDTTDETTKAQSLENVKKYASQITDLDSMKKVMPEACDEFIQQYISYGYFTSADQAVETLSQSLEATESRTTVEDNYGTEISDWLFSDDTAVGSTNYSINEDSGYATILLKTGVAELDSTEVYSVRHILIMPESADSTDDSTDSTTSTQDKTYTEEEWNAAKDKANEVLDKFNAGDKSEKSFAELAEEYSGDTESTSKGSSGIYGGLYEGITLGQMVSEFENWATDKSRQSGDVGIVQSDYGYHIMYFIYDGPIYYYNAKTDLLKDKENQMLEETNVKKKNGMKKTMVAEPQKSTETTTATQQTTVAQTTTQATTQQ